MNLLKVISLSLILYIVVCHVEGLVNYKFTINLFRIKLFYMCCKYMVYIMGVIRNRYNVRKYIDS